jgi:hypothetical protein
VDSRPPERGLAALQSPGAHRGLGKRRGAPGVHTEGFGGLFDGEVRPASVKLSVGRLGARRVGNGGVAGMSAVRRGELLALL